MRLWQCSICGRVGFWGPGWAAYSSFRIDDEFPSYRVIACSKPCEDKANAGHENGTIVLPRIRGAPVGRLTSKPVGYQPQPSQEKLIRIWNERHPTEQIGVGIACNPT